MHKYVYILILFTFFFVAAQAQKKYIYQDTSILQQEEPYSNEGNEIMDTNKRNSFTEDVFQIDTVLYKNELQLSPDSIAKWKNLKQYGYLINLDSLLREKNKKEKVQPVQKEYKPGFISKLLKTQALRILLWMLAISFVLFIIYKLFLTEGVFKAKTKAMENPGDDLTLNTINAETNFDELVRNALLNHNYRQAVRYQYLRTLHLLAGKNLIELAPDKTNYQYVSELKQHTFQNEFASLTLNYEYVWYGEFNIENDIYRKIETGFLNLNKKI